MDTLGFCEVWERHCLRALENLARVSRTENVVSVHVPLRFSSSGLGGKNRERDVP